MTRDLEERASLIICVVPLPVVGTGELRAEEVRIVKDRHGPMGVVGAEEAVSRLAVASGALCWRTLMEGTGLPPTADGLRTLVRQRFDLAHRVQLLCGQVEELGAVPVGRD